MDCVQRNTAVIDGEKKDKYELGELVLAYAVCQADALVEKEELLASPDGGGDLTRNFKKAVTERKI